MVGQVVGASWPVSLADAVERYLVECEWRGLSPATISQYRWSLDCLARRGGAYPVDVWQVVAALHRPELRTESRRAIHRCVRRFLRWVSVRYGVADVGVGMERIPYRRVMPRVLSAGEMAALVAVAGEGRNLAMLMLLLDTGIRAGELAGVGRGDFGGGWLRVTGKTGARLVPVSDAVFEVVDGVLVIDGWAGQRGRLGVAGVKSVFRRLFDQAQLGGDKRGPHTLRHTFATWYLRHGGGVRQLQYILGHQELTTTMRYVNLAGSDVMDDHRLHSPALAFLSRTPDRS